MMTSIIIGQSQRDKETREPDDAISITSGSEEAVIRSPETWSDPRGWEAKVPCEPLITCWACGCGQMSNSHLSGALVMAPPSCRCLTPNGMGRARGAKQDNPEPDGACL